MIECPKDEKILKCFYYGFGKYLNMHDDEGWDNSSSSYFEGNLSLKRKIWQNCGIFLQEKCL